MTRPPGVRRMVAGDWARVAEIYGQGIASGDATFETTVPSYDDWCRTHRDDLCFVAVDGDDRVIGWAAASAASDRCVYGGVVEHGVYVDDRHRRRGVGRLLLTALVEASERAGVWTVQSGVFPENAGSLALHQSCGFRVVGVRERIGQRDGRWRDVVWIERRSAVVGGQGSA